MVRNKERIEPLRRDLHTNNQLQRLYSRKRRPQHLCPFEDENKKLWVGTDRGVYIYDPIYDLFTFIDMKTENGEQMDNWVARIISDHSGNIWILIPDQGVFRYKDEKLSYYAITNKDNIKRESPGAICDAENDVIRKTV